MIQVTKQMIEECRRNFVTIIDSIDSEIRLVLTILNRICGVATRFSCASHEDDPHSCFYIQFIVSEAGEKNLLKLHQTFTEVLEEYNDKVNNELKYAIFAFHFTKRYLPAHHDKPSHMVIVLDYNPREYIDDAECFNSVEHKHNFINLFTDTVKKHVADTHVLFNSSQIGIRGFVNKDGKLNIDSFNFVSE